MFDFQNSVFDTDEFEFGAEPALKKPVLPLHKFWFDRIGAMVLLIPLVAAILVLLTINPFVNRGPLFFAQRRMGYKCRAFTAFKFRTMRQAGSVSRGAFDALEQDRITPFGRFLRKVRIDELPQIINVLRGEMSLIGPRPDSFDHAEVYVQTVPGYAERHEVMPGISGFAQIEVGYVDGPDGVRRKVAADRHYIHHASLRLDLWITWRTLVVVLARRGA